MIYDDSELRKLKIIIDSLYLRRRSINNELFFTNGLTNEEREELKKSEEEILNLITELKEGTNL